MKRKNHFSGDLASASSFILFLYCSGYFEKFMANMVRLSQCFNAPDHLATLFRTDPSKYLSGAFLWHRTPEGFDFWMQANDDWVEYRKTYRRS